MIEENWRCNIAVVYGGSKWSERLEIYEQLLHWRRGYESPMLIMGNFNEVLRVSERAFQQQTTGSILEFRNCVGRYVLIRD